VIFSDIIIQVNRGNVDYVYFFHRGDFVIVVTDYVDVIAKTILKD